MLLGFLLHIPFILWEKQTRYPVSVLLFYIFIILLSTFYLICIILNIAVTFITLKVLNIAGIMFLQQKILCFCRLLRTCCSIIKTFDVRDN